MLGHNPGMSLQINTAEVLTPPAPSASVMVLRDGTQGLEVLMVKRHGNSKVLGGVYVFPGGKLDAQDCQVRADLLDQTPQTLRQALGEPDLDEATACGLHVAALRETIEECGLFLHGGHDPRLPEQMRLRLETGQSFLAAAQAMGLRLQTRLIRPWSRWITPRVPSVSDRRFDARFFVAIAPSDHAPLEHTHEVTETVWLRPESALRQYWELQLGLVPAQIFSLMQLAQHGSADAVLRQAQTRAPLHIEPQPLDLSGQRVVCYPGDPKHPVRKPAWDGPTRLTWRNQRFEPEGGLDALLRKPLVA